MTRKKTPRVIIKRKYKKTREERAVSVFNCLKNRKDGLTRNTVAGMFRWNRQTTYNILVLLVNQKKVEIIRRKKKYFYRVKGDKNDEK